MKSFVDTLRRILLRRRGSVAPVERAPCRRARWFGAAAPVALFALAAPSSAGAQVISRFALSAEGGAAGLVGGGPAERFGPGAYGAGRLSVQIAGPVHAQLSAATWWFEPRGGDPGRLTTVTAGPRLWFPLWNNAWGGPMVDVGAGLGFTGGLLRFAFEAGVGWQFAPTRWLALGPVFRYALVLQPDDAPQGAGDAHVLMGGVLITLHVPPAAPAQAAPAPRDGDHDGVPDARDRCPEQAEDPDGFRDDDGCPDPDNDGDGIPDVSDRCPDQAEVRNGFEDEDGCADQAPPPPPPPAPAPAPAAPAMRPVGEAIIFGYGTHRLHHRMVSVVRALCDELQAHPEYARVRLVGHADETGSEDVNHGLSAMRATEVARALMRCGVAPGRLEEAAMGSSRPVCTEREPECWRRNRRVQAFVVEP